MEHVSRPAPVSCMRSCFLQLLPFSFSSNQNTVCDSMPKAAAKEPAAVIGGRADDWADEEIVNNWDEAFAEYKVI